MGYQQRWVYRCVFCGFQDWFSRPLKTGQRFLCSVECLAAHEAGLAEKLDDIPVPREW